MTFDTKGAANAIKDILAGLTGIGGAQVGVPESIGPRVYGYVTAGSMNLVPTVPGTVDRDMRYTATLAYRLDGDEGAAETALMDLLDLFLNELKYGFTLSTGDRVMNVDTTLADTPEYIARTAKEYREYPVVITVRQRHVYT